MITIEQVNFILSLHGSDPEAILKAVNSLPTQAYVYCLLLEGGHYYIGYTTELDKRLAKHHKGMATAWTKLHKVVSILETIKTDTVNGKALERETTLKYMTDKGWQKVRGAAWTQCNLAVPPVPFR